MANKSESTLRRQAYKYDLRLTKRRSGGYMLLDLYRNYPVYGNWGALDYGASLEDIEAYLAEKSASESI